MQNDHEDAKPVCWADMSSDDEDVKLPPAPSIPRAPPRRGSAPRERPTNMTRGGGGRGMSNSASSGRYGYSSRNRHYGNRSFESEESFKLCVTQLPPNVQEADIREAFKPIQLAGVDIPRSDSAVAYIRVTSFEDQQRAIREGAVIRGKSVQVQRPRTQKSSSRPKNVEVFRAPKHDRRESAESHQSAEQRAVVSKPKRKVNLLDLTNDKDEEKVRPVSIFGSGKPREETWPAKDTTEPEPAAPTAQPPEALHGREILSPSKDTSQENSKEDVGAAPAVKSSVASPEPRVNGRRSPACLELAGPSHLSQSEVPFAERRVAHEVPHSFAVDHAPMWMPEERRLEHGTPMGGPYYFAPYGPWRHPAPPFECLPGGMPPGQFLYPNHYPPQVLAKSPQTGPFPPAGFVPRQSDPHMVPVEPHFARRIPDPPVEAARPEARLPADVVTMPQNYLRAKTGKSATPNDETRPKPRNKPTYASIASGADPAESRRGPKSVESTDPPKPLPDRKAVHEHSNSCSTDDFEHFATRTKRA